MIKPALQDGAFLTDVHAAAGERDRLHLWWLGQSGFLLQYNGIHLLVDPYLSDSLTNKYAATDKPHVRMTERVVDPARLDFIDVVTSTHNHTDHLDAETLRPLIDANPELALVVPEANRAFVAERLNCELDWPIGLRDGETKRVKDVLLTGAPAAHESLERDEAGYPRFMGYVAELGPYIVYHSGDTVWFPGMEEILRPCTIDIALLPINGRKPERRVAGNLDGAEAARLAHEIHASIAIPCHYDMFEFNTASPDDFTATCGRLGQRFAVLKAGERWTAPKRT